LLLLSSEQTLASRRGILPLLLNFVTLSFWVSNYRDLLIPSLDALSTAGQPLQYLYYLKNTHNPNNLYTLEMALLSAEHLAGPGYIILNVLRGLNIIALASVVASSVVMLVKTFIVSKVLLPAFFQVSRSDQTQFFFFDACSHVITAVAGLFLIISECSLFRNFFARNWPLLSPSHGFVTLGCAMIAIGLNMLGNMNKEATSQKSLGMPFWRLLVASGILSIVIGFFNVVAVSCSNSLSGLTNADLT
jgi:hypothetical protein